MGAAKRKRMLMGKKTIMSRLTPIPMPSSMPMHNAAKRKLRRLRFLKAMRPSSNAVERIKGAFAKSRSMGNVSDTDGE